MSLSAFPTLLKKLKSKDYRDAYVSSNVKHSIARQIRSIREQRQWTQKVMGEKAGKPQNVISRLENPSSGQISVQTLLELASAYDVGLIVRFVRFDELIRRSADVSPKSFEVPDFNEELNQAISDDDFNNFIEKIEKYTKAKSNLNRIEDDLLQSSVSGDRMSAESENMYSGQERQRTSLLNRPDLPSTPILQ